MRRNDIRLTRRMRCCRGLMLNLLPQAVKVDQIGFSYLTRDERFQFRMPRQRPHAWSNLFHADPFTRKLRCDRMIRSVCKAGGDANCHSSRRLRPRHPAHRRRHPAGSRVDRGDTVKNPHGWHYGGRSMQLQKVTESPQVASAAARGAASPQLPDSLPEPAPILRRQPRHDQPVEQWGG